MTMPHLDEVIRPRIEVLTIVWLAMTASIGVYAMVVAFAAWDVLPRDISPFLAYFLRLVASALVALSVVLPRRLLSDRVVAAHMHKEPQVRALATNLRTGQVDPEELRHLAALPPLDQRLAGLVALAWKPTLIGLALSEAAALVGLVLGLAAQSLFAGLPMLAAALVLNLWHYPRPEPLLERGRKLQGDAEIDALEHDLDQMEKDLRRRPARKAPRPGVKRP